VSEIHAIADDSYPVQPEVGKVGTNSPSFILPVAERSDGIKAFFTKASPAKAAPAKSEAIEKTKPKSPASSKATVKSDPDPKQETIEELGDDSNAPNPLPAKRKSEVDERTGGKKTKIERKSTGGDKVRSLTEGLLIIRRSRR
jgi:hypothetical protein